LRSRLRSDNSRNVARRLSGVSCQRIPFSEDGRPSPADVAETEAELKKHGKDFDFHMYPNAGHGFFAVDRPSYRQEAAVDGWEKVFAFYGKHLKAGRTAGREAVPAGDS